MKAYRLLNSTLVLQTALLTQAKDFSKYITTATSMHHHLQVNILALESYIFQNCFGSLYFHPCFTGCLNMEKYSAFVPNSPQFPKTSKILLKTLQSTGITKTRYRPGVIWSTTHQLWRNHLSSQSSTCSVIDLLFHWSTASCWPWRGRAWGTHWISEETFSSTVSVSALRSRSRLLPAFT